MNGEEGAVQGSAFCLCDGEKPQIFLQGFLCRKIHRMR
ncbi:hypothetical protein HMPREF1153_0345 [Selenomonas sp. CM52]|nr:hypothetical protein HMPREF1153_0345 [Selenomonas sp. CM52]